MRLTRKAGGSHHRHRRTRRRVQKGGAAWSAMQTEFGDRWAVWTAKLQGTPFAPLVAADATDDARLEAWVRCITDQETLFQIAMEIIKEKLGSDDSLKEDFSNAAAVDARKGELFPYLEDVQRFIQFKADVEDPENPTKLQRLRRPETTLSKLFLFPGLITNTFLTSLVGIMTSVAEDPSVLARAAGNPAIEALLADQYRSLVFANAYYLTASEPQDGFFLNQGVTEFLNELNGSFFRDFVREFARLQAAQTPADQLFQSPTAAAGPCATELYSPTKSWGWMTAHIGRAFVLDRTMPGLLRRFAGCSAAPAGSIAISAELVPDVRSSSASLDGVPLSELFNSMGDTTLQYLLLLRARLQLVSTPTGPQEQTATATEPPVVSAPTVTTPAPVEPQAETSAKTAPVSTEPQAAPVAVESASTASTPVEPQAETSAETAPVSTEPQAASVAVESTPTEPQAASVESASTEPQVNTIESTASGEPTPAKQTVRFDNAPNATPARTLDFTSPAKQPATTGRRQTRKKPRSG